MTPHDHRRIVPGCFRCELGRDEADAAMTRDDARWFVAYEDDGPLGPCGQDMHTTSRWRILYEYDNEDDACAFFRHLSEFSRDFDLGRRKPRAVGFWSGDGSMGRIENGPIVPAPEHRR